MNDLHKKIKALRKKKRVTLDEVGKAIGMSKGHLSRIERGEATISEDSLEALAKYFQISAEDLIKPEDSSEESLLRIIAEKDAQIKNMRWATESFIMMMAVTYDKEIRNSGLSEEERMDKVFDRIFSMPGISYILNGENTTQEFSVLQHYRLFQQKQSQIFKKEFDQLVKKMYDNLNQ